MTGALVGVCKALPGESLWEIPKQWSFAQLYYAVESIKNFQERADADSHKRADAPQGTDTQNIYQQPARACSLFPGDPYPGSPEDIANKAGTK